MTLSQVKKELVRLDTQYELLTNQTDWATNGSLDLAKKADKLSDIEFYMSNGMSYQEAVNSA